MLSMVDGSDGVQAQDMAGSIGDNIWLDLDGDGIQGTNENSIPGVMVILTDSKGAVSTTITDGKNGGNYLFSNLAYGAYTVSINPLSLPPGLGQTYDRDGLLDQKSSIIIDANNVDDRTLDFGYEPLGSIGDTIWLDANGDGFHNLTENDLAENDLAENNLADEAEKGIADVVVIVADSSGNTLTTTTNMRGNYLFDGLSYGLYTVSVDLETLPPNMRQSYDSDGTLDSLSTVILDSNSPLNRDQDFGYKPLGSIGDTIWLDRDGNGIPGLDESGIANVTLILNGELGHTLTQTTDINGHYLFEALPYGTYTMTLDIATLPSGVMQTHDSDGTLDHRSTILVDSENQNDRNQNFGYTSIGSIGNRVWLDGDGDGIQDASEAGLPDVTVMLTGNGHTYTTTTTANIATGGHYRFDALPFGRYTVTVDLATLPASVAQTFDDDGLLDHTSVVTLDADNLDDQAQDFGYQPLGSIGDMVWLDSDDNGVQGPDENGIPGVILMLIHSDGKVSTTATDAEAGGGHYLFDRLPYGIYTVAVDPTTLPPFLSPTGDEAGYQFTVTVGVSQTHHLAQDFGYRSNIDPRIDLELFTRGAGQTPDDADTPPGPAIPINRVVVWTYEVTNRGNVDLANIELEDDVKGDVTLLISGDDDSDSILDTGETWRYSVTGVARRDQYSNQATVSGQPVDMTGVPLLDAQGQPVASVSDTDSSHYFGVESGIDLEKAANSEDADVIPGPIVPVGSTVSWAYAVTNIGNVALDNITVSSDQNLVVDCPSAILAADESMTCTATATAEIGQYEGLGSVYGTPIDSKGAPIGPPVRDQDTSHYYGSQSSVHLERSVNGADADQGTGPFLSVGDPIIWRYTVSNRGNTQLSEISLTDEQNDAILAQESSPGTNIGDLNENELLDVDEVWIYEASGLAGVGQHESIGLVQVQPVDSAGNPLVGVAGEPVSAQDMSHYVGNIVDPGLESTIVIESTINNVNADNAPGIYITPGEPVVWNHEVRNTGKTSLMNVDLSDDHGIIISAEESDFGINVGDTNKNRLLDEGEIWRYVSLPSVAQAGQHENIVTAQAMPVDQEGRPLANSPLLLSDPSHYFGTESAIRLTMLAGDATDGNAYFTSPGNVFYTLIVENLSNVPIRDIKITDDSGTPEQTNDDRLITESQCPKLAGPLAPAPQGGIIRCIFSRFIESSDANIASVTATLSDSSGDPILSVPAPTDSDEARVRITEPAIALTKNVYRGRDGGIGCGLGEGQETIYTVVSENVTYCFLITNSGNTYLDRIQVIDDYLGITLNYSQTLAPGRSTVLHHEAVAQEDLVSIANVIGLPSDSNGIPTGQPIVGADGRAKVEVDLVTIGNFVWFDQNGDGQQDSGEPPVGGVTVTLLDGGTGDVVLDPSDNPVMTVTDGGGHYSFDNLPPGNYAVQFDLATLPAGYRPTRPNQGSDGSDSDAEPDNGRTTTTGILFGGDEYIGLDMGIVALVTVGDRVWYDNNGDDLQGDLAEEPGVPNITIILLDGNTGQPILDENGDPIVTVTDSDGNYLFADLQPGNYAVGFSLDTLPDGYVPTGTDNILGSMNSNVSADMKITPSTGFLRSGSQNMRLDLGIVAPVSLGNRAWQDDDRDGLQDSGEPGIAGITVFLLDGNSGRPLLDENKAPVAVITDSDGNYVFDNLHPGNYAVQFNLTTLPAQYLPAHSGQGLIDPHTGKSVPTGFLYSAEHIDGLNLGCILLFFTH